MLKQVVLPSLIVGKANRLLVLLGRFTYFRVFTSVSYFKLKDFLLQRHLQRLEKHGNNDLLLIMEFGGAAYSTYELADILEEVKEQKEEAKSFKKLANESLTCVRRS